MHNWLPLFVGLCVVVGIVCVGLLLFRVWHRPPCDELPRIPYGESRLDPPRRPEIWNFPQFRSRWRPRRPYDQAVDR